MTPQQPPEGVPKAAEILHRAAAGKGPWKPLLTAGVFVVFYGLITLFVMWCMELDHWLRIPRIHPAWIAWVLGTPFMAVGGWLAGWCVALFLRRGGTPVPTSPPPGLIVTGPYAHSRNPMVGGALVFLFGLGIVLRSVSAAVIGVPVLGVALGLLVRHVEEPELRMRFGAEYVEYCRRVPRLWPKLW